MDSGVWFTFAIVFLLLALIAAFFIFLYLLFWKPTTPSVPCNDESNCTTTQACLNGVCTEITCSSDADCNTIFDNGRCVESKCYALTCINGNDCPDTAACVSTGTVGTVGRSCVTVGAGCTNNTQCKGLSCIGATSSSPGTCQQCGSNLDCPVGQACTAGVCRFPVLDQVSPGLINIPSVGQANGNVLAPPGFFCPASTCATMGTEPLVCNTSTPCPDTCPFCINNVCRCTPGILYEPCSTNTDCESQQCLATDSGKVCAPPQGQCVFNYNNSPCVGCCPVTAPYCTVAGVCSTVSLGAICGSADLPVNMCADPTSLGAAGVPGLAPNGMGFFCVNGTCTETPGPLNSLCSGTACLTLTEAAFVCSAPIIGEPNRCQSLA